MLNRVKTFRNVRTRVHRLSTALWLAGWVVHLSPEAIRIRLKAYVALKPGERIDGECYGDGTVARFSGVLMAQSGHELAIRPLGSLTYQPSNETVRYEASGLTGILREANGTEQTLMVLDVSPESLGGLSERGLLVNEEPSLILPTEWEIETRVRVINCRLDPTDNVHYRVGLSLIGLSRLDNARWARLIESRSEA